MHNSYDQYKGCFDQSLIGITGIVTLADYIMYFGQTAIADPHGNKKSTSFPMLLYTFKCLLNLFLPINSYDDDDKYVILN